MVDSEPGSGRMPHDPLFALAPVDGRYEEQAAPLRHYLSEWALIRERVLVEVEWLIEMSTVDSLAEVRALTPAEVAKLRAIPAEFTVDDARRVKRIERDTRHDVKAVEIYLRERLVAGGLGDLVEWVHFCCTSEDISNLAYARLVRGAVSRVWLPAVTELVDLAAELAVTHRALPMAGRTHGQLATPTTVGKELAVFVHRWRRQLRGIRDVEYLGKFGGAVGAYNAHAAAYPTAPWPDIARRFVARLGLCWNPLTTQVDAHDWLVELLHAVHRHNAVLRDFVCDMWLYLCLGGFRLRSIAGEVGSSTMPHKVNPAAFENAEANIAISSGLIETLARELPVSRLQRDLSDSAKLRNLGTVFGHSLLAVRSATAGLRRLEPDGARLAAELESGWELLTEAVQTVLRKHGVADSYQRVKRFCADGRVDRDRLHDLVCGAGLPPAAERDLLALTPAGYTGLSAALVDHIR